MVYILPKVLELFVEWMTQLGKTAQKKRTYNYLNKQTNAQRNQPHPTVK